jgi:hypothetical protein
MPSPQYRDDYEGRGTYAQENHAMLDRERERTAEWQRKSTRYRATMVPLYFAAVALVLAAAVVAAIYYLAVAGPR